MRRREMRTLVIIGALISIVATIAISTALAYWV